MSKEHIRAIARLDARSEKTEELRALLTSLLEPTCQERGCVRFELMQNRDFPTEFAVASEWRGEDAVQHQIATSRPFATLSGMAAICAIETIGRRRKPT